MCSRGRTPAAVESSLFSLLFSLDRTEFTVFLFEIYLLFSPGPRRQPMEHVTRCNVSVWLHSIGGRMVGWSLMLNRLSLHRRQTRPLPRRTPPDVPVQPSDASPPDGPAAPPRRPRPRPHRSYLRPFPSRNTRPPSPMRMPFTWRSSSDRHSTLSLPASLLHRPDSSPTDAEVL